MGESTVLKKIELSHRAQLTFAWVVWGLAATFYFSDYLARVAPGVMHRSLQIAFGINEAGFGILTASFYLPYIIMQIPVGLTVDRVSIRGILTAMSVITALGCVVFGLADSLTVASIGRMLIGFSAAFLFIVLAGLLYRFIRDSPGQAHHAVNGQLRISVFESLRIVLSHRQTWLNAFYAGFLFAPTAVIGESIGPAYLQYGRGLSAHAAAFATGLIFIGWGISGPLSGLLSDRLGKRKPILIASAVCGLLLSSLFVFYPNMTESMVYILFFMFGVTNTGVAIAYAVCTEIQPSKVVGTAIGFTNMASIFVGALMQPLVGRLIDTVSGTRAYNVEKLLLSDFQYGLKLLPICSLIALILACTVKETYCRHVESWRD